ncbi:MAG: lysophospholipid acyltransferase family protein [Burkholderiaceae bacterium]|nr:lysophospholipid acyltransferase family protein [Burkholderiaceae bacterium]
MSAALGRLLIALIEATHGWSQAARTRLANVLGDLAWWLAVPRRRVALANLRVCFPQWSEARRRQVARACFRNMARALLDHAVLARAPREVLAGYVRAEGVEHLRVQDGRPLLLIAPHFAGLNAGGVRTAMEVAGVSIYARQRNATLDAWMRAIRGRFNAPLLIPREGFDLRAAVRAMQQGRAFYYLPDQDYGPRHSIFVPFFGVPAATIPMVARLAKLTGARVVMTVTEMTADGYVLHVEPPWADFPGGSIEADTARMNREIERWVERMPAQYLWLHKRFKTRPPGAAPIYRS